jgi:hypothetical protein
MPPVRASQRNLFEEAPVAPAVQLPREMQEQLRQALVHWMQAIARMIREEDGREQDHR